MVKLGWRLINEKDSLWVRVLRSKYKCGADLMPTVKERPGQLNLWKGVSSGWQYVEQGIVWRINDVRSTYFWTNNWMPGVGPFKATCFSRFR